MSTRTRRLTGVVGRWSVAYRVAIRDVLSRIQTQVQSPLDPRFANQVSATRHAAVLQSPR